MEADGIRTYRMACQGMQIECLVAGEGPLVLFLHGFPDHAATWREQLTRFAAAGFQAVAPMLRGYTPGSKAPDGVYQDWATGGDALALIDVFGHERASLIGHDWGAAAAYAAAQLEPARLDSIITLAVPFGSAMRAALLTNGEQQRRSWYWFFFQQGFAGDAVAHNDFKFLERLWCEWSPGHILAQEEVDAIKTVFRREGVLEETLAYYRQLFNAGPVEPPPTLKEKRVRPISVPTLYLHGRDDGCIGVEVGDSVEESFTGPYERVVVDDAGHFLHLEQPDVFFDRAYAFVSHYQVRAS